MPHLKAFGMMNLQYEIIICHKIHDKGIMSKCQYKLLFKWDRRYHKFQVELFNLKHLITCNVSAQSLCSRTPKFFFILATSFKLG